MEIRKPGIHAPLIDLGKLRVGNTGGDNENGVEQLAKLIIKLLGFQLIPEIPDPYLKIRALIKGVGLVIRVVSQELGLPALRLPAVSSKIDLNAVSFDLLGTGIHSEGVIDRLTKTAIGFQCKTALFGILAKVTHLGLSG